MKLATILAALLAVASLPCPTLAEEPGFEGVQLLGTSTAGARVERLPESDTLATDETRAPLERERRVVTTRTPATPAPAPTASPTPTEDKTATSTSADDVVYVGTDPTNYFHLNQDELNPTNPNACGTTSLSMILANNGCIDKTLAAGRTVDDTVRPWGGFSAPSDLRDFAGDKGLKSSAVNGASFAQLKRALANGNSVMAMVDGGGSPHWIVVLGVETNVETGEETVVVADPGDHRVNRISRADFEHKWKAPMKGAAGGFLSDVLGYHNYFLAFNRDGSRLPPSSTFGITATENAVDGVTDVANSWSQLKHGQVFTALTGLAGGVTKVVTALPGVVGSVVETAGDGVLDWAHDKASQGGFFNTLGAIGGYTVGVPLKIGGAVLGFAGNAVSSVGGWVGNAVESVGGFVDDVLGSIF